MKNLYYIVSNMLAAPGATFFYCFFFLNLHYYRFDAFFFNNVFKLLSKKEMIVNKY